MSNALLIGAAVAAAGVALYARSKAKAATKPHDKCDDVCNTVGNAGIYGAAACAGCRALGLGGHVGVIECPPGTKPAADHRAGLGQRLLDMANGKSLMNGLASQFSSADTVQLLAQQATADGRVSGCIAEGGGKSIGAIGQSTQIDLSKDHSGFHLVNGTWVRDSAPTPADPNAVGVMLGHRFTK